MPRKTYKTRLQNLLEKDYISDKDRSFIASLLGVYNEQGRLSPRRAQWVARLEERYKSPPKLSPETISRISTLVIVKEQAKSNSWDYGFLDSVIAQLRAGGALSDRQKQTISKIEDKYSSSGEAAAWRENYTNSTEKQEAFNIAISYYENQGSYYRRLVRLSKEEGFIPTENEYNLIVKNKYSKKVLAGYYDEPKYAVGSFVALRESWIPRSSIGRKIAQERWSRRRASGPKMAPLTALVVDNAGIPRSACAGNKVYTILVLGTATPFDVEERDIKKLAKKWQ